MVFQLRRGESFEGLKAEISDVAAFYPIIVTWEEKSGRVPNNNRSIQGQQPEKSGKKKRQEVGV